MLRVRLHCVYSWLLLALLIGSLYPLTSRSQTASPESLPPPTGPVVLIISGNLLRANVDDEAHLDLDMIRKLDRIELRTTTPWESEPQSFTGVRISDLLAYVGSRSQSMVAFGFDDYRFTLKELPLHDFPIIIAYQQNGQEIPLRQLGPLRIVFPYSDYPELDSTINEFSAVWQLVRLQLL